MNRELLGEIFIRLLPDLRDLVHVPQGFDKEDALHEALVDLLAHADQVPEDTFGATKAIREAVVMASKHHLRERTYSRRRHALPHTWQIDGKWIGRNFLFEDEGSGEEKPIESLPDPAMDIESSLIEQERHARARRLAVAIEADQGPRGVLYRTIFVEQGTLEEAAQKLGISYTAAKNRLYLLRRELREAYEAEI